MTGVSNAPRASSTRSLRHRGAGGRWLGASVVLTAFAAAACASELADGNPTDAPPFSGGNAGQVLGPDGKPVNQPGVPGGGGEGNPKVTDRAPAELGGNIGKVTDDNGNPLPVDQLPTLAQCSTPGPQTLRRLTSTQFRNTLRSVFGDAVPDSQPLNDVDTLGYNVDADDLLVQGLDSQAVETVGSDIAAAARQNGLIAQLANNCTNLQDENCRRQFVSNVGARLSREPLDDARIQRFAGLFTAQGEDGTPLVTSFDEGAEMVISAMVQSPFSIYRREIGVQQGGEFVLTPYEVASELSYMLTNNPPDDTLMAAASGGQLSSPDAILAQADRLLQTPEAEDVLAEFVARWLDNDRLIGKVKGGTEFTDSLRAAMLEESAQLFMDIFFNGGTIGDLFSSTHTFMNQELANFYGLQGMANSPEFTEVDISGGVRVPGMLGHAAYLASHALTDTSSPVQRAFVVRERILCNPLPEVPTNLDTNLRAPAPNATTRERYTTHSESQVCYNCHQLMDPVGFSFEAYDGFGRFRDTEGGNPVDSNGSLMLMENGSPSGIEVPLTGVTDLTMYLSASEETRACLISNLSYFSYGIANTTKWSAEDKTCTDNFVRQAARDSGNTLKSVMTGILTAPHFTRRVQAK
jgi:hypothetical protein